jgi:hypothetical protein
LRLDSGFDFAVFRLEQRDACAKAKSIDAERTPSTSHRAGYTGRAQHDAFKFLFCALILVLTSQFSLLNSYF